MLSKAKGMQCLLTCSFDFCRKGNGIFSEFIHKIRYLCYLYSLLNAHVSDRLIHLFHEVFPYQPLFPGRVILRVWQRLDFLFDFIVKEILELDCDCVLSYELNVDEFLPTS